MAYKGKPISFERFSQAYDNYIRNKIWTQAEAAAYCGLSVPTFVNRCKYVILNNGVAKQEWFND